MRKPQAAGFDIDGRLTFRSQGLPTLLSSAPWQARKARCRAKQGAVDHDARQGKSGDRVIGGQARQIGVVGGQIDHILVRKMLGERSDMTALTRAPV